ncbi:MAG: hypothetical protein CSB48_05235 [Proteobacteria bacterium]|nr:MAG: hypothetical protein CSB48_05235 [Pseudomonadota bacterium]
MKFLKLLLFGAVLLVIVFTCLLLFTASRVVSEQPLVKTAAELNTNSAVQAKRVAKQLYEDLLKKDANQQFTLKLSEQDVNGIIALATRGFPRIKGRVNIAPVAIMSAFTLDVPDTPLGKYINLTATISPSSNGLSVDRVSFGSIEIPGGMALGFLETLLNIVIDGDSFGTKLIRAVDSLAVTNSTITLKYHPVPDFRLAMTNTRKKFAKARNNATTFGDPKVVKAYYDHICAFHSQIRDIGTPHFGYYLGTAFSLAEKRSHLTESPIEENKAALLALAIFLGSGNFDSVIGALDQETFAKCQPQKSATTLANRNDLRLHFIFSAALKLLSDSGLSFAIGEFKELLDTQQGGSGFSYADLAADRAGIRFAELSQDKNGALRVQTTASRFTDEQFFFPDIADLPEGVSRKDFEQAGGIDSNNYKSYLATINRRIEKLPLYTTGK